MGRYLRRPTSESIQAIQFTGDNFQELWDEFGKIGIFRSSDRELILRTAKGCRISVAPSSWVTPDESPNTFYSIDNDVFVKRFVPETENKPPIQEQLVLATDEVMNVQATHMISVSVLVNGPQQWERVFGQFSELVQNMGCSYPSATVSSHTYDDEEPLSEIEEDLYYDENTLHKVARALRNAGMTIEQTTNAIREMQNARILFHERMP